MVHRKVQRPGQAAATEEAFVWHGGSLIAIFDRANGQNRLKARLFYGLGDSPIAADMDTGTGAMQRLYFLQENNQSVMALADEAGQILERYSYDAWGQPVIDPPDNTQPVIKRVSHDAEGLIVEFNERILPPPASVAAPSLIGNSASIAAVMAVTPAGGLAP